MESKMCLFENKTCYYFYGVFCDTVAELNKVSSLVVF